MSEGQFLFLGTGSSMGVPVVGCHCKVCLSKNLYNKRLRSSALVTWKGRTILIDTGPDFRYQALRANICAIDGVIFTHAHYDHTAAIDELRIFQLKAKQPLPCLLSEATLRELKIQFYYIFQAPCEKKLTANLAFQILEDKSGAIDFLGLPICYTTYAQGGMEVNGFRFGDLAYLTDIKEYNDEIFAFLRGVKTLILGALRLKASHLHFTVDEACEFAKNVQAEKTWLTHIAHEVDYESVSASLPAGVFLSYDGLKLDFHAE